MAQDWRNEDPTYSEDEWTELAGEFRAAEQRIAETKAAKAAADLAHADATAALAALYDKRGHMIRTERGRSGTEIGLRLGIARERVGQIAAAGDPGKDKPPAGKRRRARRSS